MTVAVARVTLFIGGSHSLKEKRMVIRRVKDLVRGKFNASIAEVGAANDLWQKAVLGISLVANEPAFAEAALDEVLRFVRAHAAGAEVTNEERELQTFADGEQLQGPGWKHWEG